MNQQGKKRPPAEYAPHVMVHSSWRPQKCKEKCKPRLETTGTWWEEWQQKHPSWARGVTAGFTATYLIFRGYPSVPQVTLT